MKRSDSQIYEKFTHQAEMTETVLTGKTSSRSGIGNIEIDKQEELR